VEAIFFASPSKTGRAVHPASVQWVSGLFPVGKRPGYGLVFSFRSSAEVKERVGLYLCFSPEPSCFVLGLILLVYCLPEVQHR
jgi:hypothetical protein